MPYKVLKTGPPSKPYCVWKHDEAGHPVGKSLGCHVTQAEAERQITAIEMNTHIRRVAGRHG